MKKVLIITYYWPPTGGSGVQRWLKFAKYLPEFNWEPIIYTPKNPDANAKDNALLKEISQDLTVIKTEIKEPYSYYKKFIGKKNNEQIKAHVMSDNNSSFKQKLSVFIRGNFFIPDPRCWWIRPSVKYLTKYLKEHPVDIIVSTGPPHSMHLIAEKVSKATGTKWIADFRDPWTEIFYYNQLRLTKFAKNRNKKLEQSVLDNATEVVVVTKLMQEAFQKRTDTPISLITNGFDEADFETTSNTNNTLNNASDSVSDNISDTNSKKFNLVYTGLLSTPMNPDILWDVLGDKVKEDKQFKEDLKITVMGQTDTSVIDSIKNAGIIDNFTNLGYVPHNIAINWQKKADILLLTLMKGEAASSIITGKAFEYIASGSQILTIGPTKGDLGNLLRETESGTIYGFSDYNGIRSYIDNSYFHFKNDKNNNRNNKEISPKALKYSRRNLTKQMAEIFNKHCK